MRCVQNRCFAGITSESNESIARVAGCVDAHQFFVDSPAHIDGTARACGVRGMLNGAPRRSFSARIRITPGR